MTLEICYVIYYSYTFLRAHVLAPVICISVYNYTWDVNGFFRFTSAYHSNTPLRFTIPQPANVKLVL